ncbi:hypothetical protein [Microtetraspora sp. NBRC 16547]|uniref:hypothetical protein n=1 Tax=Microtetraspora sp. NBRC 16547 TaxID=3030993 RepID=UPI0024A1F0A5|nr:hypothetical protein [Microtetraspora sp. NBRC 16547]GLW97151.1 hypothetical protein Misp02_12380 [Microtetraspora sp. NBRC 16547]
MGARRRRRGADLLEVFARIETFARAQGPMADVRCAPRSCGTTAHATSATSDYTTDPRDEWWSGRMIPVGDDQNGEYLLVDSARKDVAGTFIEDGGTFTRGADWSSSYALLRATADALTTGEPLRGRLVPQVTGGALGWIDVDDLGLDDPDEVPDA